MKEEIEKLYNGSLKEIISIYEKFERDDIISWMKERPSADMRIYEVEGDKDVVVVIPTANVKSELARKVMELYKGLHIVFVESNGQYFNYARSVNYGIEWAEKNYSPDRIVISNDDVTKADSVDKLRDELSTTSKDLVMASKSTYHTYEILLVNPYTEFLKGMRIFGKAFNFAPAEIYGELLLSFKEKFNINAVTLIKNMLGPMWRFSGNIKRIATNAGSFAIIKKGIRLNDIFINSHEDVVLSLTHDFEIINYKIKEMRGASLGFNKTRFAKMFVNEIYFNYLLEKGEIRI